MSVVKIAALSLTVLFLLVAVVRLFHRPLRLALRVVFNSALGLLALWILERTAPVTGLALGVKGRSAEEMAAASRAELDARHSEQEQALARARIARAVSRMHVKRDGK